MKQLPDFDNVEAMAAWGRRSALLSARREAQEALRDACTLIQSADMGSELIERAESARSAVDRLLHVAGLWERL